MSLRYLSVCSGIEAATVAWHPLGWVPVAFSEIEDFPSEVLAAHYPTVPNLGDMTKFKQWPDYAIDLLVGGTPCQAFSVAGLREGLADPRGNLALTFLALARRYRPRWVVWENVPGVHSSWSDEAVRAPSEASGGRSIAEAAIRDAATLGFHLFGTGPEEGGAGAFEEADQSSNFDCILAGMEELGYGIATRILDAQYFGVAQRRRRVFVVGYLGAWQVAASVLFEPACLRGDSPPSREARKDAAGTITRSSLGGGSPCGGDGRESGLVAGTLNAATGRSRGVQDAATGRSRGVQDAACGHMLIENSDRARGRAEVAGSVCSKWSKGTGGPAGDECQNLVAHTLRAGGHDASEDGTGRGGPLVTGTLTQNYATHHGRQAGANGGVVEGQIIPVAFSCKDSGADAGEVSPTLRSMSHNESHPNGGGQVAVAVQEAQTGVREYDTAGTLRADGPDHDPVGTRVRDGLLVRRLTPRECERLQGFPDDYTAIARGGAPAENCSDGPRYRALGNSMATVVMRWIGERISAVEAIMQQQNGPDAA